MPLEHGLPTGPFASRLRGAGGGPVDNPAAYHMHTHPSPPSFRLIPQLELTACLIDSCRLIHVASTMVILPLAARATCDKFCAQWSGARPSSFEWHV